MLSLFPHKVGEAKIYLVSGDRDRCDLPGFEEIIVSPTLAFPSIRCQPFTTAFPFPLPRSILPPSIFKGSQQTENDSGKLNPNGGNSSLLASVLCLQIGRTAVSWV